MLSTGKVSIILQLSDLMGSSGNPATQFPRKTHPGGECTVWLGPRMRSELALPIANNIGS